MSHGSHMKKEEAERHSSVRSSEEYSENDRGEEPSAEEVSRTGLSDVSKEAYEQGEGSMPDSSGQSQFATLGRHGDRENRNGVRESQGRQSMSEEHTDHVRRHLQGHLGERATS